MRIQRRLSAQQKVRRQAKRLVKPSRHVWRQRRFPIDQSGQRRSTHAQEFRPHEQWTVRCVPTRTAHSRPGGAGASGPGSQASWASVIVLQIQNLDRSIRHAECQPTVPSHPRRPDALAVAGQLMKPPGRRRTSLQVSQITSLNETEHDLTDTPHLRLVETTVIVLLNQASQSAMANRHDIHVEIVRSYRSYASTVHLSRELLSPTSPQPPVSRPSLPARAGNPGTSPAPSWSARRHSACGNRAPLPRRRRGWRARRTRP